MKKLIIYGFNELAKELIEMIRVESQYVIKYIALDLEYLTKTKYKDIDFIDVEKLYEYEEEFEVLITFGYTRMNDLRREKYEYCKNKGYKICTFISQKASVYTQFVGEGSILMPNTMISANTTIGICNIVYGTAFIGHDNTIGDYNFISASSCLLGNVNLGNNCFIGGGSVIKSDINIANRTLIGAGSVLKNNTDENDVIVPERSVKINQKSYEFY